MFPNNNIFNIILYTGLLTINLNTIICMSNTNINYNNNIYNPHNFYIFIIFLYTTIINIHLIILYTFSHCIGYTVPFIFNIHYFHLLENYNLFYCKFIITIKKIIFSISYCFYFISFIYTTYFIFVGFKDFIIEPQYYILQYFLYFASTFFSSIFIFIFSFYSLNYNINFFDILYLYKIIIYYFNNIYVNKPLLAKNIIDDILNNTYTIIDIKHYLNDKKIKCNFCECTICLNTNNDNNYYVILNCLHKYHYNCIFKWINNKLYFTCPLCRQEHFI